MIANRRRPGTTSRKSSSRLPARSVDWYRQASDVAARPRQTRDEAGANRVRYSAKTIGMTDVACFAARTALPPVTMTSTFSRTNSAAISAIALAASLRPAILDRDGAALDPTEFAQPPHKSGDPMAPGRRRACPGIRWSGACACCALRGERYAAAAPPSSVTNSRRDVDRYELPGEVTGNSSRQALGRVCKKDNHDFLPGLKKVVSPRSCRTRPRSGQAEGKIVRLWRRRSACCAAPRR